MANRVDSEVSATIDGATNALTIVVREGKRTIGTIIILPDDVKAKAWAEYAMMHGMKQRIVDAAALGQVHTKGDKKGQAVTAQDKYEAMYGLVKFMYEENTWARRAAAGEGDTEGGLLLEAVMRATGASQEDCQTLIDSWDKKQQAAMRDSDATIAPIVAAIRVERAAKRPKVDTSAALAALMKKPIGEDTDTDD